MTAANPDKAAEADVLVSGGFDPCKYEVSTLKRDALYRVTTSCRTGNREKLSSSQVRPSSQLLLTFPSFPVWHPVWSPCTKKLVLSWTLQKPGSVKCEIGWQEAISSNDSHSYLDNQCINLLDDTFASPFLASPPPVSFPQNEIINLKIVQLYFISWHNSHSLQTRIWKQFDNLMILWVVRGCWCHSTLSPGA